MNNNFSLQQISRTSTLDANSLSRQFKLNLMAVFMRIKYENPKLKQSQIANKLGYPTSTLQRSRNDMNPIKFSRIPPKKRSKKISKKNFLLK